MLIYLSKDNISLIKHVLQMYENELCDNLKLCRTKSIIPIVKELSEIKKVKTALEEG